MTATTVTGAVAVRERQDKIVAWVRAQQDDIAMIAASHVKPAAIVRVTQGALRRNDKLMAAAIANPQSLLYALLDAARLGHEPDTDDYYLVPFGNEVTGIEGYKGIIERMYRAGGVTSVVAEVVRQRDVYRRTSATTPPVHEYDEFADPAARGELRGAYAYAVMPGGGYSKIITMGRAEIMEHKAKSRGSDRSDSPWQQWEPAMWKKTVLRALEPYVPTSTEYRQAPAQVPVLHPGHSAAQQLPAADIVDAELVSDTSDPGPDPTASSSAGTSPTPATATTPPTGTPKDHQQTSRPSASASPAGDAAGQPAPKASLDRLDKLVAQLGGLGPDEDIRALYQWLCGTPWEATRSQVTLVISWLTDHLTAAKGDIPEATSAIWRQYRDANPEQPETTRA